MVGVLIVDDHEAFRRAAGALVRCSVGFQVVAEAASGEEAVIIAEGLRPALVLMDVNMPGMGGIEATRRLLDVHPGAVVFLCSAYPLSDLAGEAATCGARGYVDKRELAPEVLGRLWPAGRESTGH